MDNCRHDGGANRSHAGKNSEEDHDRATRADFLFKMLHLSFPWFLGTERPIFEKQCFPNPSTVLNAM
jgi:hypothetical protein